MNLALLPDTISLDPFLDHSGDGSVRCSSPDPSKYHDVNSQSTENGGVPLGHLMRSGFGGIHGVIIPRSTPWGASRGWNPNNPPSRMVVIDPHDPKSTISVDLAKVTAASAKLAIKTADQALGRPTDVDGIRLKAAAAFHVMGKLARDITPRQFDQHGREIPGGGLSISHPPQAPPAPFAPQGPVVAASFGVAYPQPVPQPAQPAPLAPEPVYAQESNVNFAPVPFVVPPDPPAAPRPVAMLSGFAPGAPAMPSTSERAYVVPIRPGVAPEPTYSVIFDMPQGEMQAPFHTVTIQPGAEPGTGVMLLGYDDRHKGVRFFPKVAAEPFAAYVDGSATVYLVSRLGRRAREHARSASRPGGSPRGLRPTKAENVHVGGQALMSQLRARH